MKVEESTVKKRGRKSKKEIEQMKEMKEKEQMEEKMEEKEDDNITVLIEEQNLLSNDILNDNLIIFNDSTNEENVIKNDLFFSETKEVVEDENKPSAKKRGRKPKGGKIIQQIVPIHNQKETKPSVILHLKCSLKDLQVNTILGHTVHGFNFPQNNTEFSYEIISNNYINNLNLTESNLSLEKNSLQNNQNNFFDCSESDINDYEDEKQTKENDVKEMWKKLKNLEHNLHINNISDKKSACFWCTYEFDNPPIYIPKHYIKDSYHVYGCFCSPECASAYLMEENIDSSSKFERYHLMNHIYSKIYDYKKNIKPAPNPYYMLEKYYGNLNIQEYRSLLKNERLFLVVDKPLTRILPELHEDNDDFIINNKIIPSNTYQIKKKLQKKQQTKNNILTEKFGLQ